MNIIGCFRFQQILILILNDQWTVAFLCTIEVSSQEYVYRFMPELWLRKISPKTVFVNTDLPDKRVCVTRTTVELDALDDDSTDIYKSNMIECYSL